MTLKEIRKRRGFSAKLEKQCRREMGRRSLRAQRRRHRVAEKLGDAKG